MMALKKLLVILSAPVQIVPQSDAPTGSGRTAAADVFVEHPDDLYGWQGLDPDEEDENFDLYGADDSGLFRDDLGDEDLPKWRDEDAC